jgi:hypothetical protein
LLTPPKKGDEDNLCLRGLVYSKIVPWETVGENKFSYNHFLKELEDSSKN